MANHRDPVVEAVRADLLERSQVGLKKYGIGLDRKDLKLRDWLQHAYEETLDEANYLKRAIMELDEAERIKPQLPLPLHDERCDCLMCATQ